MVEEHSSGRRLVGPSRRWQFHRSVSLAIVLGATAGCSMQPQIQYVPQRVEVPVIEKPPAVAIPPIPHLAIQDLTHESSDAQMMAAWVATVAQLKADDQRLRVLLMPYASASQPAGTP